MQRKEKVPELRTLVIVVPTPGCAGALPCQRPPPSWRHCWTRSRPALRVPSVVHSSAARYYLPQASGSSFPPYLPGRATSPCVWGVAVSSTVPLVSRPIPRDDWSLGAGRGPTGFSPLSSLRLLGKAVAPSAADLATLG